MTVVIVDDSPTQRRFVRIAVADDPAIVIVGEADNGRDGVALVERLAPAVVLMDLHLPVMNGIEAIERIMATRPTPIVVYSAFVSGPDRENAAAALAAGAIDIMPKPGRDETERLDEHAAALAARLRVAGRARVIRHLRGRLGQASPGLSTRRLAPAAAVAANGSGAGAAMDLPLEDSCDDLPTRPVRLLAIGASTGGPPALAQLLAALPDSTETAVLVVQHMADGFMAGLADWLDTLCPLPVRVATHGSRLGRGEVSVAPDGCNLTVDPQLAVTISRPPPGQYHVPGIDVTFASVAQACGAGAVGVLLTGMGRDGAAGLKAIHDQGGFTVGQDEATCAVYGMPAAAVEVGAVDLQLPLPDIGLVLRRLVGLQSGSHR